MWGDTSCGLDFLTLREGRLALAFPSSFIPDGVLCPFHLPLAPTEVPTAASSSDHSPEIPQNWKALLACNARLENVLRFYALSSHLFQEIVHSLSTATVVHVLSIEYVLPERSFIFFFKEDKHQRYPNTGIVLKEFCYYDYPFWHRTTAGIKEQSASGQNDVICQDTRGCVSVVRAPWSRQRDGVCNRHMKNSPFRCCLMLWRSYKLHQTKGIDSRAVDIPGGKTSTIWKERWSQSKQRILRDVNMDHFWWWVIIVTPLPTGQ